MAQRAAGAPGHDVAELTDATAVVLEPHEALDVVLEARRSFKSSGGRTRFEPGRGDDLMKRHLEGTGAKFALAKHMNRTRLPARVKSQYTPLAHGNLIVPRDVAPNVRYVLVTGRLPEYKMLGWCFAGEAEQLGDWRDDVTYPGWFVAPVELRDMAGFGRIVRPS